MQTSKKIKNPGIAAEPYFSPNSLTFLRKLERNNRREWFEPRKQEFERDLKQPMLALVARITEAMAEFAPMHVRPPQKTIMRIYRDTRFSSDKRPYKHHVAAWWSRDGLEKTSGAGYYFHISGREVIVAAGVYMPEREQLLAIRKYLLDHHAEVRRLLEDRRLRGLLSSFSGEPLTRAPRGFPKAHPGMDLLLCRQWGLSSTLPAEAALSLDFPRQIIRRFRAASRLVDALNAPLIVERKQKASVPFGFF